MLDTVRRQGDTRRMASVDALIAPGREVERAGADVVTALAATDRGGPYDRLIGARLYNRLIWDADPRAYTAFAAEAVADGHGPLLDVGCGTAVFTASAYREARRPLVLVDRSLGMLGRAAERLAGAPV